MVTIFAGPSITHIQEGIGGINNPLKIEIGKTCLPLFFTPKSCLPLINSEQASIPNSYVKI